MSLEYAASARIALNRKVFATKFLRTCAESRVYFIRFDGVDDTMKAKY